MLRYRVKTWWKRGLAGCLALMILLCAIPMPVLAAAADGLEVMMPAAENQDAGNEKSSENTVALVPLYREIAVQPGQLVADTGEIVENEIYGYVVGYELKKGHILSISNPEYVFSVRQLVDGNYSTMLKQATTASFIATEDMTVGMLIRKPDKSALTAEDLASIVVYDSQYAMIGVEGYAHRFTVEVETIEGGTATTRANIFLPASYTEDGIPTRLIVMTNGYHGYLTDSVWNGNSADDAAVIKHYLDSDYAVLVVDNTAQRTTATPDLGCPQLVSSYWKAYDYVQANLNVEERFAIHSRSMGTFAAIRIMREHPELVKCGIMCGPIASLQSRFSVEPAFIANRFGFDEATGATYEADKVVGYDPYTDVNGDEYTLPPTFWMMTQSDAVSATLTTIEKIKAYGNEVQTATYTDTDHSGVCRLNIEACRIDSLAFLEAHQTSDAEHRFCAWVTTKVATCTEAGEMRRNCADCDHYETMELEALPGHICAEHEKICTICGAALLEDQEKIPVVQGQFSDATGQWQDSDIYGCVIGYTLKKGHILSISDENYVFSVRQLVDGNYNTMLKAATVDDFTAVEDMTVAIRVRKPDKAALTAEELAGLMIVDTSYTVREPLAGKTISILGDSISTFSGVSNNTTYNSTIGSNSVYYSGGTLGVQQADTWWQQVIDALGMKLLVNNSWSGSCILKPRQGAGSEGYGDRCVNLHNDATGEEPDVIAVFLGTNDFSYYQSTLGTADAIDYDALITENGDGSYTYATPSTSCEAYAIMLHKMTQRYPEAEIYCMTLLPRRDPDYADSYADVGQPTAFNAELKKIITRFGAVPVDLEDCGITSVSANFDVYMGDKRVHPNALGMDKMSQAVINALMGVENASFVVSQKLTNVLTDASAGIVLAGDTYSATLTVAAGFDDMTVTVTMGGEDITGSCYADGKLTIPSVTGDVVITATGNIDDTPDNYRWELDESGLVCTEGDNALTPKAGSVTDGVINNTYYSLEVPVILRHDQPWVVEWKASGSGWSGMIFSANANAGTAGNSFLFKTTSTSGFIGFGERVNSTYENYGVALSNAGVDTSIEHVYRVENRIDADGTNMAYLIVDGVDYGVMDHFFIGGSNDQGRTVDWLNGRDFCFSYIGASSHPINNCTLEYLQVWEGGIDRLTTGDGAHVLEKQADDSYLFDEAYTLTASGATLSGKIGTDSKTLTLQKLNDYAYLSGNAVTYTVDGEKAYLYDYTAFVGAGYNEPVENGLFEVWRDGAKLCAFADLQSAINYSKNGDVIEIAASFAATQGAVVNKNITIDGNGFTVDVSGWQYAWIVADTDAVLKLQDICIDGGASGFVVDYDGVTYTNYTIPLKRGSLDHDVKRAQSPVIVAGRLEGEGLDIRNSYTASYGGAIRMTAGSMTLQNSTFTHNYGTSYGGAIYIGSKFLDRSAYPVTSVSIENCTFTDNYSGHGGAVYAFNTADMSLRDCAFTGNTANGGKGGALCLATENITAPAGEVLGLDFMQTHVENCSFDGNWAGNDGFAIQTYDSDLYLTDCSFTGNVGVHPTSSVGTVSIEAYRDQSQRIYTSMVDCIFAGNIGPVSCYGDHSTPSDLEVTGCEFRGNIGNESILLYSAVANFTDCRFVDERVIYAVFDARIYENYDVLPHLTLADVTIEGTVGAGDILVRKQEHNLELNTYTVILEGTTAGNIHIWDGNAVQIKGSHTGNVNLDTNTSAENLTVTGTLSGTVTEHPDTATAILLYPYGDGREIARFLYLEKGKTYEAWTLYPKTEGHALAIYTDSDCITLWDLSAEEHVTLYGVWETHGAHTAVTDAAVAPTCTETGLTQGSHCAVCGEVLTAQQVVDALGHDYESVATPATCTERGYTTHTCTKCGDSYVDGYVDALGHDMGAWSETLTPGCETAGEERWDCRRCGYFETREVESAGHDHESVVTQPTCTERGYTTHTCHCGDSYVDHYVNALGHSFTAYISDGNATVEADGTKTAGCDNDGCHETHTLPDEGSKLFPEKITSEVHTVSGGNIRKISVETTVGGLLAGILQGEYCKVYDDAGEVQDNRYAGTGMTIKLEDGDTVKDSLVVIVTGDVNGDGTITVSDVIAIKAHILQNVTHQGAAAVAADVNGDDKITVTDFVQVKAHILRKSQVKPW